MIQTVVAMGDEIPTVLRRLGRSDLAEQAEGLPDLAHRRVEFAVDFAVTGPIILESFAFEGGRVRRASEGEKDR